MPAEVIRVPIMPVNNPSSNVAGFISIETIPGSEGAPWIRNRLKVDGSNLGALAICGDFYNHVLVAIGYNEVNPLPATHQVAVWTPLKANQYCTGGNDGFVIGFETALGSEPGVNVDGAAIAFSVGTYTNGVGSALRYSCGLSVTDEVAGGTGNAAICRFNDLQGGTLAGDWFIYYSGTRESHFGAKITCVGNIAFGQEIHQVGTAAYSRMSGGTAGNGGTITGYGSTHATLANQVHISASGNFVITGTTVHSGVTSTEICKDAGTSFLRVAGGLAGTGGNIIFYGAAHATNAGQLVMNAAGGLSIAAATTITGDTAVTGAFSVTGNITTGSEIIRAVTNSYNRMSGGTAGNGGSVTCYGSTHATNASQVAITGSGGVVFTGALVLSGVTSTEISKEATASFIRVSGGTAGGGGNIVFYGSTHATNANQLVLSATGGITANDHFNLVATKTLRVNSVQVVTARQTGWTAATGTATRTSFATGSVTTAQLAERVKALIDDFITHGLIGA